MAPPRLLRSLSRSHSSDNGSGVLDIPIVSPGRGSAAAQGSASKPLTTRDLPRPDVAKASSTGSELTTTSADHKEVRLMGCRHDFADLAC